MNLNKFQYKIMNFFTNPNQILICLKMKKMTKKKMNKKNIFNLCIKNNMQNLYKVVINKKKKGVTLIVIKNKLFLEMIGENLSWFYFKVCKIFRINNMIFQTTKTGLKTLNNLI